jgi:hypothetical protein
VKLRSVTANARKRQLELVTRTGTVYPMPFVKLVPRPTTANPIAKVYVDPELGNEAVTYRLMSGREGTVHIDHALDYNRDPAYLAGIALHELTIEARTRIKSSGLSVREVARRLGTSVPQLYRLLDTANYSKGFVQMHSLLNVLDCDVQISVKPRARNARTRSSSRARKAA